MDAYHREGRAALRGAGATEAGRLYERMLRRLEPDARVDVVYPADADDALPSGSSLADYDGIAWTGSSLTIRAGEDPHVRRQVELARSVYRSGRPSFGSCWAAQLSVVAAGGSCAANPAGREFGVARAIALSPEGRRHPMYEGKPHAFDALTSHADEVAALPDGVAVLASNAFTRIQALCARHAGGAFWAVQYHPEFDLHEIARLCHLRVDELVAEGHFPDRTAASVYIEKLEALHRDPDRADLASALDVGEDVLDPERRTLEVRNWIEHAVKVTVRG